MSVAPPGGNGTTRRIGRVGQSCPEPVAVWAAMSGAIATHAIAGSKQHSGYRAFIAVLLLGYRTRVAPLGGVNEGL
jgi:hypothetical protein